MQKGFDMNGHTVIWFRPKNLKPPYTRENMPIIYSGDVLKQAKTFTYLCAL